jgi:hypothetical protein
MEIERDTGKQRKKDLFLFPLFLLTGVILIIHILTFFIYLGLGDKKTGNPTKTNALNSMWWSLLTIFSALFLLYDIWFRCNKGCGPLAALTNTQYII